MQKRMNRPRLSAALVPAVLLAAGLLTPLPAATAQEKGDKSSAASAIADGAARPSGMTVVEKTPPARAANKKKRTTKATTGKRPRATGTGAAVKTSVVAAKTTPLKPIPRTFLMTAADTPMLTEKTITVLTEDNEFATVQIGVATRTLRGEAPAPWEKIEPGDQIRCQGYWDVDGYRFQATVLQVGGRISELALDRRVADACKRIGQSRISGGFGVASAAPAPGTPGKALVPSDKPATDPVDAKPGEAKPAAEGGATPPAAKPAAAPPAT